MKTRIQVLAHILIVFVLSAAPLAAKDLQSDLPMQTAIQAREMLTQKAVEEKTAAETAASESRMRIQAERANLEKAVAELEATQRKLTNETIQLEQTGRHLAAEEAALTSQMEQTEGRIRALAGQFRITTRDFRTLMHRNLQIVLPGPAAALLATGADEAYSPGMDEVRALGDILLDLIRQAGEISLQQGPIIDREGRATQADILRIGPFTTAYRQGHETGFLKASAGTGQLHAHCRLPGRRVEQQLAQGMEGGEGALPLDLSGGEVLNQLAERRTFRQFLFQGGITGWLLAALFMNTLLLIIERLVSFQRRPGESKKTADTIGPLAAGETWGDGKELCTGFGILSPLAVVAALDERPRTGHSPSLARGPVSPDFFWRQWLPGSPGFASLMAPLTRSGTAMNRYVIDFWLPMDPTPANLPVQPRLHLRFALITTWLHLSFFLLLSILLVSPTPDPAPSAEEPKITVTWTNLPGIEQPEKVQATQATKSVPTRGASPSPPADHRLPGPKLSLPLEITPQLPSSPVTLDLPPAETSIDAGPGASASPGITAAAGSGALFSVGQLDAPLTALAQIPPMYPLTAKRRNLTGWVKVRFVVDEQGQAGQIIILAAEPAGVFEQSVLRCINGWRFKPGTIKGAAVKTLVEQTITFKLE